VMKNPLRPITSAKPSADRHDDGGWRQITGDGPGASVAAARLPQVTAGHVGDLTSSTSMNTGMAMTGVINHGLRRPAADRCGVQIGPARGFAFEMKSVEDMISPWRGGRAGYFTRTYGTTDHSSDSGVSTGTGPVKDDLHGHALTTLT